MIWVPKWKKNNTIRHILTGKPMLVVHIYNLEGNSTITVCMDLEDKNDPTKAWFIPMRDYDNWVVEPNEYDLELPDKKIMNGV